VRQTKVGIGTATRKGSRFFWVDARLSACEASARYARVRLESSWLTTPVRAGQYVLVRHTEDPCLPRAFSVLASSERGIELLVKSEGRVREKLSCSPIGTLFQIRGPYGVPYLEKISMERSYLLVGGGSGITPLLCFHAQYPDLVAGTVYGFRTADALELLPDVPLVVEEVDGELADERVRSIWSPGLGIIACGPEPMLRALAREYRDRPDVYVSLEARIGCGIGSCLGCSIPTTTGTQRICRDGPLFAVSELPWLI